MPLMFFLKLYARVAGLTALVVLLCVALFVGVNSVRSQFWHERFPEPLMRWLQSDPAASDRYHWLGSLYNFSVLGSAELESLSAITLERLGYHQVVAVEGSTGYRILVGAPEEGRVLQVRLDDTYKQVAEAVALIVRWHLDSSGSDERSEMAARMSEELNVRVRPVDDVALLPSAEVLDQVARQGMVFFRDDASGQGQVLIRLEDGELLRMDMAGPFDPWAWPVILLMVLVIGSVLAVALYLGLREVDSNLRKVESVAIRIARGEMGARVEAGTGTLVSRLAASFNGMAEHIQRLVQVQREMIHAVSHELRTPVARIRFGVQMIESCQDKDRLQKQLDDIDGDIQELDELIDEILTYARLEQGGPVFSLQEASVTDLVRQVVSEQQIIRPALVIEADIEPEAERWAMSDVEPRYIHRAIQNLVGNAGRYAEGRVLVRCHIDEDNCRIDVEDDGPGVPEQDWEKVFTAFARLDDSRTRTSGGYGLGLSIVRRILYWHGGQAFVGRSDALGGARFSLVWPRKKPVDAVV
ncbi:ATP-binding protein [Marinobacter sp. M216]|uniref:histidine kinase n=1 Tax=Marinobacter albus TaxID=3030833 RepID=A0ABT7HG39_9GAMM|nr:MULTISPECIES: ATP-binding protein [unclassified Marinobacter]MBW7472783.1 two-component sensor histidine kinase [Marinobacter sp. F4218]MDK9559336.1 ATP-binding protein [Marinobacter sp. M216]